MLTLHAVAVAMAEAVPGAAWDVRREGMELVVEVDQAAYSDARAAVIRGAIRAAHRDVDQMIRSGLVGDIRVEPRTFGSATAKRAATRG